MAKPQPTRHKMPRDPKPTLAVKVIPVFRVHYLDLEAYIKTVFGFDYHYLESTGTAVGQVAEYVVDGQLPSVEWQRKAEQVREGRRTRELRVILAVLAADEYVAKGRYIIATKPKPSPISIYTDWLQASGSPDSKECTAIKAKFSGDPAFVSRAAQLDQAWLNRKNTNG